MAAASIPGNVNDNVHINLVILPYLNLTIHNLVWITAIIPGLALRLVALGIAAITLRRGFDGDLIGGLQCLGAFLNVLLFREGGYCHQGKQ